MLFFNQIYIRVVNIRKTTPKPRNIDAMKEIKSSRTIFRDLVFTSRVKNQARKKRPNEMHTKLRCGTNDTGIGA